MCVCVRVCVYVSVMHVRLSVCACVHVCVCACTHSYVCYGYASARPQVTHTCGRSEPAGPPGSVPDCGGVVSFCPIGSQEC